MNVYSVVKVLCLLWDVTTPLLRVNCNWNTAVSTVTESARKGALLVHFFFRRHKKSTLDFSKMLHSSWAIIDITGTDFYNLQAACLLLPDKRTARAVLFSSL